MKSLLLQSIQKALLKSTEIDLSLRILIRYLQVIIKQREYQMRSENEFEKKSIRSYS